MDKKVRGEFLPSSNLATLTQLQQFPKRIHENLFYLNSTQKSLRTCQVFLGDQQNAISSPQLHDGRKYVLSIECSPRSQHASRPALRFGRATGFGCEFRG